MNPLILDEIDSTNSYAKNHFSDFEDGEMVFARSQTAGRGREGRRWLTPPGLAMTGTAIFKHLRSPFHGGCILGVCGLSLIRQLLPEALSFLKWPNDIYVADQKLAGILSEGIIRQGVVTGMGMNINQDEEMLKSVGQRATSLKIIAGKDFCVEKLAKLLAKMVKTEYIKYQAYPDHLLEKWRNENLLIGEMLEVATPAGERIRGVFSEITPDGGMVLRLEKGEEKIFNCGDVKIDAKLIDFERVELKKRERDG